MTQLLKVASAADQSCPGLILCTSCWWVIVGWRASETSENKLFCVRNTNLGTLINSSALKGIQLNLRSMKHLDSGLCQRTDFKNYLRGPFNPTALAKDNFGKWHMYWSQNHISGCIWWPSKLLKQTLAALSHDSPCNTIQSSSQDWCSAVPSPEEPLDSAGKIIL